MKDTKHNACELRLLVAIASFGQNHLEYLKRIIKTYRSMAMHVDIVVVCEAPKALGPGVEVLVGLPARNPWSLPFAHKRVLAENVGNYDLFAYSEDDVEVTEAHIQSFLRVSPVLAEDEIVADILSVNSNVFVAAEPGAFDFSLVSGGGGMNFLGYSWPDISGSSCLGQDAAPLREAVTCRFTGQTSVSRSTERQS